eukprot:NODE_3045_length_1061_cov_32.451581_g2796_i0.p1 GENE.NODE_3045_length_1061_cov_32.451581_g2796_i0~~NODE_3045_length_1061_cov_32.451581_g2796_i0.p1  ORF type:complete len:290 (+),score=31.18 NODE_3045_length_1061_cov_32.451581_g2796_i0:133-1002(+)
MKLLLPACKIRVHHLLQAATVCCGFVWIYWLVVSRTWSSNAPYQSHWPYAPAAGCHISPAGYLQQQTIKAVFGHLLVHLEGSVMVDVGAHKGGFTELMLRAQPSAVFAVEPDPRNTAALLPKMTAAALPGALFQGVASNVTTDVVSILFHKERSDWNGGYLKPLGTRDEWVSQQVPSITLEAFLPRGTRIGLLKVDVQGNEYQVLSGLGSLPDPMYIVLGWNAKLIDVTMNNPEDVWNWLCTHHYRCTDLYHEQLRPAEPLSQDDFMTYVESTQWVDLLCAGPNSPLLL